MTMANSLKPAVPHFPYLQNGDNNIICFIGLLWIQGVHLCKLLPVVSDTLLFLTVSSSLNLPQA